VKNNFYSENTYQNGEKYTKTTQKIPNVLEIYEIDLNIPNG
jgi:hypothetical protein